LNLKGTPSTLADRPNEGYVKEGLDDLPFQSIDTGMGLDRTVMVLNGFTSVYSTDLFQPILKRIVENCDALPESWHASSQKNRPLNHF
jgi:alanyl-tRNA synthetase